MAVPDAGGIVYIKGKLSHTPTSLTTAYPHGGTALGEIELLRFAPAYDQADVLAEEFGGKVVEKFPCDGSGILFCVLREFRHDDTRALLQGQAVGTTSNKRMLQSIPGGSGSAPNVANRAGIPLSQKAVVLVVTPEDPERDEFLILYNAIPAPAEAQEFALHIAKPLELVLAFTSSLDANYKEWRMAKKVDLKNML